MGIFGVEIKGPDGRVIAGQVSRNDRQMRAEWQPDVMRTVGEYMRRVVLKRNFDTSGAYLGAPWTANSPNYADWKASHWDGTAPGIRTGAMLRAFTEEPVPFSMSGLTYPDEEPTDIRAMPILKWSADFVTIGASVTEDGEEYTEKFNDEFGSIFGSGEAPGDAVKELGKLLSIPFMAGADLSDQGIPTKHDDFPDDILLGMITEQALREVFA
jgi:hypothetical protein